MPITAKFEADFSQFKDAVASADGSLKTLEGTAQTLGPAILASLASHQVRQFATDVKNVATEFIGAFAEEEAAVKKLGVALQNQGTAQYMAQYTALAAEFQRTTVNSDDLILSMTALLVQVGNVAPSQMQAALTAATNLSAGLGIDLQAATLAVAKGFDGGTTALLKMVPSLKGVIKEGATMNEVMLILEERYGGQALAQLDTHTGKVAKLANQMSDFKEKIGGLLVDGLTPLINAFASMPESLQTVILGVVAIGAALAPLALSFAAVVTVLTPLVPLIGAGLTAALAALVPFLLPAGAIILGVTAVYLAFKNWSAITGIAQAVYEGVKTWLVDKFQAIVDWVNQKIAAIIAAFRSMYMAVQGGSIVPDMIRGIAAEFQKLDRVMVQPTIHATRLVTTEFEGLGGAPMLSAAAVGHASGGGGVTVNNHIFVNGTAADVARQVAAEILKTVKQQQHLS